MENLENILDPDIGKEDLDRFCDLLPNFLSVVYRANDLGKNIQLNERCDEMIEFLKDKTDSEVEALISGFILRNSKKEDVMQLSHPELLEIINMWARTDRIDLGVIEEGSSTEILKRLGYSEKDLL